MKLKEEYIQQVKSLLEHHPDVLDICKEVSAHIDESIYNKMLHGYSRNLAMEEAIIEMGDPNVWTKSYLNNARVKLRGLHFVLLNWCFFMGGVCITIGYQMFDLRFFNNAWAVLVDRSFVILLLYMIYWIYVGFYIGKNYGPNGKKHVQKTIILALIPNVLLMILVVFQFVPPVIFSPILTPLFLVLCVLATGLFYPVSRIAFHYGIVSGL